jgi:hypothetical protein
MSAHRGGGRVDLRPPHPAYDVRIRTCRTVAAYHRLPPWAVATLSRFNTVKHGGTARMFGHHRIVASTVSAGVSHARARVRA